MKQLTDTELYNLYRGMARRFGRDHEDSYAKRKQISADLKDTSIPIKYELLVWATSAPWGDNSPGRRPVPQTITQWYKTHKRVPYHLREFVAAKIAARKESV